MEHLEAGAAPEDEFLTEFRVGRELDDEPTQGEVLFDLLRVGPRHSPCISAAESRAT